MNISHETIGIFGSVSRGEDTPESDVDVLYAFRFGGLPLRSFLHSNGIWRSYSDERWI
ncbi:nucleotidyltransferase domain-containing protein [Methanocorpusculum vombati]|uniref:nucleotidyltransferase domain-containing protein n=1 Tax=Methanocorpusculum vombati TaxID=3002864 RepID=UPI003CCC1804